MSDVEESKSIKVTAAEEEAPFVEPSPDAEKSPKTEQKSIKLSYVLAAVLTLLWIAGMHVWYGPFSTQPAHMSAATPQLKASLFLQDGKQAPLPADASEPQMRARNVMAIWYFSTTLGQDVKRLFEWEKPVCEWSFVGCSSDGDGAMIKLDLRNVNVGGALPEEIGTLTELEDLVLDYLGIEGPIPTQVGRLVNLRDLVLGGNHFFGPIPSEIGNLVGLTNLCLKENKLSGSIPTEIGRLTKLWGAGLRSNALVGALPTEVGNMVSLNRMTLSGNHLDESLPTEMKRLSLLNTFFVHDETTPRDLDPLFCADDTPSRTTLTTDCLEEGVTCSCCTQCCDRNDHCVNA